MELIGAGRMAEVNTLSDDTVVKLDRVEFNGVAGYEANIVREVARSGFPVPQVVDTVVIEGRHGIVMERLRGPLLTDLIRTSDSPGDLAEEFVELHVSVHAHIIAFAHFAGVLRSVISTFIRTTWWSRKLVGG